MGMALIPANGNRTFEANIWCWALLREYLQEAAPSEFSGEVEQNFSWDGAIGRCAAERLGEAVLRLAEQGHPWDWAWASHNSGKFVGSEGNFLHGWWQNKVEDFGRFCIESGGFEVL